MASNKAKAKLKKCPFCGVMPKRDENDLYVISYICKHKSSCYMKGINDEFNGAVAIRQWNRRADER